MTLRGGLLSGQHVALRTSAPALAESLQDLGATTALIEPTTAADEAAATDWVKARPGLTALVYDARHDLDALGLTPALERAWICARAVASGALIPSGGGRLVMIAPAAATPSPAAAEAPEAAQPLATAAQAALENLARTLSTEWARHRITPTALCPASDGYEAELATLVSFLLSRAGGYFTGCRFDLGAVAAVASG